MLTVTLRKLDAEENGRGSLNPTGPHGAARRSGGGNTSPTGLP